MIPQLSTDRLPIFPHPDAAVSNAVNDRKEDDFLEILQNHGSVNKEGLLCKTFSLPCLDLAIIEKIKEKLHTLFPLFNQEQVQIASVSPIEIFFRYMEQNNPGSPLAVQIIGSTVRSILGSGYLYKTLNLSPSTFSISDENDLDIRFFVTGDLFEHMQKMLNVLYQMGGSNISLHKKWIGPEYFILAFGEGKKTVEFMGVNALKRTHLFQQDAWKLQVNLSWSTSGLQILYLPSPICDKEVNPAQPAVDILAKLLRAIHPEEIDHNGLARYISFITKGYRCLQTELPVALMRLYGIEPLLKQLRKVFLEHHDESCEEREIFAFNSCLILENVLQESVELIWKELTSDLSSFSERKLQMLFKSTAALLRKERRVRLLRHLDDVALQIRPGKTSTATILFPSFSQDKVIDLALSAKPSPASVNVLAAAGFDLAALRHFSRLENKKSAEKSIEHLVSCTDGESFALSLAKTENPILQQEAVNLANEEDLIALFPFIFERNPLLAYSLLSEPSFIALFVKQIAYDQRACIRQQKFDALKKWIPEGSQNLLESCFDHFNTALKCIAIERLTIGKKGAKILGELMQKNECPIEALPFIHRLLKEGHALTKEQIQWLEGKIERIHLLKSPYFKYFTPAYKRESASHIRQLLNEIKDHPTTAQMTAAADLLGAAPPCGEEIYALFSNLNWQRENRIFFLLALAQAALVHCTDRQLAEILPKALRKLREANHTLSCQSRLLGVCTHCKKEEDLLELLRGAASCKELTDVFIRCEKTLQNKRERLLPLVSRFAPFMPLEEKQKLLLRHIPAFIEEKNFAEAAKWCRTLRGDLLAEQAPLALALLENGEEEVSTAILEAALQSKSIRQVCFTSWVLKAVRVYPEAAEKIFFQGSHLFRDSENIALAMCEEALKEKLCSKESYIVAANLMKSSDLCCRQMINKALQIARADCEHFCSFLPLLEQKSSVFPEDKQINLWEKTFCTLLDHAPELLRDYILCDQFLPSFQHPRNQRRAAILRLRLLDSYLQTDALKYDIVRQHEGVLMKLPESLWTDNWVQRQPKIIAIYCATNSPDLFEDLIQRFGIYLSCRNLEPFTLSKLFAQIACLYVEKFQDHKACYMKMNTVIDMLKQLQHPWITIVHLISAERHRLQIIDLLIENIDRQPNRQLQIDQKLPKTVQTIIFSLIEQREREELSIRAYCLLSMEAMKRYLSSDEIHQGLSQLLLPSETQQEALTISQKIEKLMQHLPLLKEHEPVYRTAVNCIYDLLDKFIEPGIDRLDLFSHWLIKFCDSAQDFPNVPLFERGQSKDRYNTRFVLFRFSMMLKPKDLHQASLLILFWTTHLHELLFLDDRDDTDALEILRRFVLHNYVFHIPTMSTMRKTLCSIAQIAILKGLYRNHQEELLHITLLTSDIPTVLPRMKPSDCDRYFKALYRSFFGWDRPGIYIQKLFLLPHCIVCLQSNEDISQVFTEVIEDLCRYPELVFDEQHAAKLLGDRLLPPSGAVLADTYGSAGAYLCFDYIQALLKMYRADQKLPFSLDADPLIFILSKLKEAGHKRGFEKAPSGYYQCLLELIELWDTAPTMRCAFMPALETLKKIPSPTIPCKAVQEKLKALIERMKKEPDLAPIVEEILLSASIVPFCENENGAAANLCFSYIDALLERKDPALFPSIIKQLTYASIKKGFLRGPNLYTAALLSLLKQWDVTTHEESCIHYLYLALSQKKHPSLISLYLRKLQDAGKSEMAKKMERRLV